MVNWICVLVLALRRKFEGSQLRVLDTLHVYANSRRTEGLSVSPGEAWQGAKAVVPHTLRKLDQKVLAASSGVHVATLCGLRPVASGNCWQLHASCQIYKVGSGMMWTAATATAPAAVPHLFAWHFLAKTDNLLVPHVRCAKFHGNNKNHNASSWHQMCKGKSCRAAAFMRTSMVP